MKKAWFLLLVVALTLRFAMALFWQHRCGNDMFYFPDSDTYWTLGRTIAKGEVYEYNGMKIHRMPGYPALLAPLFFFGGDRPPVLAARIQNCLFGTMSVAVVGWIAFLLFRDKKTALIAGWLVAVDPLNVVMSAMVLSEAPFCLAMLLQIAFWIVALNEKKHWTTAALVSGLAAAVTVYVRPDWLYFVPFAMIIGCVLGVSQGEAAKRILLTGGAICLVLGVCLVPWWIRNYQITGTFVPTTLQVGPSLYDGLNPKADGGSNMAFADEFYNAELKLLPENAPPMALEQRLNAKMWQAAVDWAWKNPDRAWKLATSKFARLWNLWPNEATLANWGVKIVVFCTYFPVLVLGLIGAVGSLRKDFSVRILWIPAVYITALHIVFVSSIRYRAPAMLCLAVLAAWVAVNTKTLFSKLFRFSNVSSP